MRRDYSLVPTSRDGTPRRPIEIVLTPMIDVIFLLLVFFLATSSFQIVEKLLPSSISETAESTGNVEQPQDPTDDALEQVIVKLELNGNVTVARLNDAPLPALDQLRDRFRAISETGADVPVVIDPEGDVRAAEVVAAYDWAREAGLTRVFLATRS